MSGRADWLDAFFDQRIANRLRHEVLRHVLHDLRLEALADDRRRHLARTEAGNLHRAAKLRGGVADRFVHDFAGHLDREIAARFVHVNNF